MKRKTEIFQVATVFIGSIVGAGLSSGRELNQFFSSYGYKSIIGLIVCGIVYVLIGKMMVEISKEYGTKSYNEFVSLVCGKKLGLFINIILTLFLLSSTSIILAGSSAVIQQYFGVPRWIGFVIMIGCSTIFLLRNTEGLFEVNSLIVPFLVCIMTFIFFGFIKKHPDQMTLSYMDSIPKAKSNFWPSAITYASFNIISIVGIVVPLTREMRDKNTIVKGIGFGSLFLTIISIFITLLMLVNPSYIEQYEIPILAVAGKVGPILQIGMMMVVWLEMFSSQISNIYSLTRSMESRFKIPYTTGIFIVLIVAMPFSLMGFSKLVEVLYPLYGVLSLLFLGGCIRFYFKKRICIVFSKKDRNRISHMHKI